jgi:hypothetical protein
MRVAFPRATVEADTEKRDLNLTLISVTCGNRTNPFSAQEDQP